MPRELRPELEALIATGHCNWHTTMDITLPGGPELWFSSGDIFINNFGKTQQYAAKLKSQDVGVLSLSQDIEVDMIQFKVVNVDMVVGRLFTGAVRKFDGAEAVVGTLFIDRQNPDPTERIWDPKMLGDLVSNDIKDDTVDLTLVSSIDSVVVSGRTISSEFQWREAVSNVPVTDPNDNFPQGGDIDSTIGCFVAGTKIRVPQGLIPIELLEVGDFVLVWDFNLGKLVSSPITKVEIHHNKLTHILDTMFGRSVRLTDEQPIYTGKGIIFRRADEMALCFSYLGILNEQDKMRTDRLTSFGQAEFRTVHHFHVEHKDHNYILENGLIAHNLKPRPGGRYGDFDLP